MPASGGTVRIQPCWRATLKGVMVESEPPVKAEDRAHHQHRQRHVVARKPDAEISDRPEGGARNPSREAAGMAINSRSLRKEKDWPLTTRNEPMSKSQPDPARNPPMTG